MTFALDDKEDQAIVVPNALANYQTKAKATVYSHNYPNPISLSGDIISCNTSKTIKGTGKLNLTLAASRNYINLLFPNDMINVYFQHDRKTGWIRTFFGYIDRIEESYSVAANGTPTTSYVLVCSGWEKAFDKTQIYFNPPLANRPDFSGSDFGTLNIAGLAIMSRGLKATGTPADIILNMIMLHFGFGGQWILPMSAHPRVPSALLQKRQELVSGILLQAVEASLTGDVLENVRNVITTGELERAARAPTSTEEPTEGSASDTPDTTSSGGDTSVAQVERLLELPTGGLGGEGTPYQSAIALYLRQARSSTQNAALLDLVNLTDYVERLAIDGYIMDSAIWEKQGPLINILRSQSNEFVNEFFFDLRPALTLTDQDNADTPAAISTEWSIEPDEFDGNIQSESGFAGPRYEAAVVLREYPFSTITRVDLTNIASGVNNQHLGIYYLGALFSNAPNKAGRHTVQIPTIHPGARVNGQTAIGSVATKHLDVAVIHEQEIISSRLGRSDQDHFNLFEATIPSTLSPDAMRYMMVDLMPIVTPIHIMRHGLRVRSVTSRFSLYDISTAVHGVQPSTTPSEDQPAAEDRTVEESFTTDIGLPVAADSSLKFVSARNGDYGYRARLPTSTIHGWKFHYGVDISGAHGTDIIAIADGWCVASAPSGTAGVSGYGNVVILYHPQFTGPGGEKIYSFYAHLSERVAGASQVVRSPNASYAEGHHGTHGGHGRFVKFPVRKGEVIGKMGRTLGTTANPAATFHTTGGDHLHFEIDFVWASKQEYLAPEVPYTAVPRTATDAEILDYVQNTLHKPGTVTHSMDPEIFFTSHGIDLVAAVRAASGTSDTVDADTIDADEGGATGEESSPSRENAAEHTDEAATVQAATNTGIVANIDNFTSRSQLARWSIMNDHWYQHNLEYLSGTITMRGAPEIRVGTRLDVVERNMSFYVEGVQHTWTYPNEMKTILQVTRGQPNNPYPAYVVPPAGVVGSTNLRRKGSRLAVNNLIPDPVAVRKSLSIVNKETYPSDGVDYSPYSPDNPDNWNADIYDFDEESFSEIVPAEPAPVDNFAEVADTAAIFDALEITEGTSGATATDGLASIPASLDSDPYPR